LRRSTRRPPRPSLRMMVPAKPAGSIDRFRHEEKQTNSAQSTETSRRATHRCRREGRSVRGRASPPPPLLRAPAGMWRPAATKTLASYPGPGLRKGLGSGDLGAEGTSCRAYLRADREFGWLLCRSSTAWRGEGRPDCLAPGPVGFRSGRLCWS
jgi:hypothetical protein